jgi:hypothetical protein
MQRGSQLTPFRSGSSSSHAYSTHPHALLPQEQQQFQPQLQRRSRAARQQQQQQQQHYNEDDSQFDEEYVEQDSAAVPPAGKGFSAQVTAEFLQQFFHLPIEEAARRCGVSTTIVKVGQNTFTKSKAIAHRHLKLLQGMHAARLYSSKSFCSVQSSGCIVKANTLMRAAASHAFLFVFALCCTHTAIMQAPWYTEVALQEAAQH